MKTFFYIAVFTLSLASCKSVEKMMAKGEYEKAFDYAIDKLSDSKVKKTEHVKALEKAYSKLNSASIKEIDRLNATSKPENWSKVHAEYKRLINRQDRLEFLLPLVSESGYKASFDIKNYNTELIHAEDNTCAYYYSNAKSLIERAESTGNKMDARSAYDELAKIFRFKKSYLDTEQLREKALKLGITYINIEVDNRLVNFHGDIIEDKLWEMPLSSMDDLWNDFSLEKSDKRFDYSIVITLDNMNLGTEAERAHTTSHSREVLVRKEKVKEIKDSVEVWVEKEVYENLKADMTEIFREKNSELHGNISVYNNLNNKLIDNVPINIYDNFKGYACQVIGDLEAIPDDKKRNRDTFLELFPSDRDVSKNLAIAFQKSVINEINRVSLP